MVAGFRSGPSGQVHYSAEVAVQVEDHESHRAASATSGVTSLESSHARSFRDDTAEPTTNAAELEDHSDVRTT